MAKLDASDNQAKPEVEHAVEEVFSSEKREDIWAIIIAMFTLILCAAFPEQVYNFFKKVLYFF
jgi:hypothetical protein